MKIFNALVLSAIVAGSAATCGATPLEIDYSQSKIEVAVTATMDSFVGQLQKYEASVDCEPATVLPSKAGVSFDFADLKTGNTSRDAAMLHWLEYDSNPKASFLLNGWKQSGSTNIALGDLTIHGVKMAVQMPVVIKNTGAAWNISGQAEFDFRDFKLPKIRKALVLTVDPHLKVMFSLVGKLPAAK